MSRKQSQKSINRLLGEYPELEPFYEPYSPEQGAITYPGAEIDVKIDVQRADANLLYWKPNDFGGVGGSYHVDPIRNLKGQRQEQCALLSKDPSAPAPRFLRRASFGADEYLRDVLFGALGIYKRTGSIVTRTVTEWYEDEPSYERGFIGEPKRIEVRITLHKEPPKGPTEVFPDSEVDGWSRLIDETDVYHNVKLFGGMLLINPDLSSVWVRELMAIVGQYAQNFERLVWRRGFGQIVDQSKMKGMSGMFGDIKVTSYVMAGRTLVQLERGDVRFTMIGQDVVTNPRFGFQSVDGTADELVALVDDSILFWATADEETRATCYHDDENIGIF